MKKKFKVEKLDCAHCAAKMEERIINSADGDSFSLYISIPYLLIKKLALKLKKTPTFDDIIKDESTKELFIILTKAKVYNYGND